MFSKVFHNCVRMLVSAHPAANAINMDGCQFLPVSKRLSRAGEKGFMGLPTTQKPCGLQGFQMFFGNCVRLLVFAHLKH